MHVAATIGRHTAEAPHERTIGKKIVAESPMLILICTTHVPSAAIYSSWRAGWHTLCGLAADAVSQDVT